MNLAWPAPRLLRLAEWFLQRIGAKDRARCEAPACMALKRGAYRYCEAHLHAGWFG